jgi:hypothetical protein
VPAIDDRRRESSTAKRVHETNGCTANCDRSNGESANRDTESQSGATEGEHQTE